MQEIWKDIAGYEGLYQISNLGNVKSLPRMVQAKRGNLITKAVIKEKILKHRLDKDNYVIYTIYKNNVRKDYKAHRLIAQAFIPNPENKPQINHKNGIKTDNRIDNLEWVSPSENILHSYREGLNLYIGEKSSRSKLKSDEVVKIFKDNRLHRVIANDYGVTRCTISKIKRKESWTHITNFI